MSAYLVNKDTIDYLVEAFLQWVDMGDKDVNEIGRTLWRENNRSVNYRYSERNRTPSYTYKAWVEPLDAQQVMESARCLEYQSCEHPGWKASKARKILLEIVNAAAGHLPSRPGLVWGAPKRNPNIVRIV